MAKIIIKREGRVVHRESKTFDRKPAASAWVKKREAELARPGEIERANAPGGTLGDAIDRYIADSVKEIGRTKLQCLNSIKQCAIADMACDKITSADVIGLAQELGADKQPSTVSNYLSHLSAVFAIARPAWGFPLDPQAMDDAFRVGKRLGITGKSKKRDRRPTLDELDRILSFFNRRRSDALPMVRVVAFAIFSTRRLEEIIRIKWADFEGNRICIRDMKSPTQKLGNDVWADLPAEATRIIEAMPRENDRIFPYGTDAISAAFTRACQTLGIIDLRFHDLRHDGVSRLFEIGYTIPAAAMVSGHRSWTALQRYTHIRQTGDKYTDWKWLDEVTSPLPPRKPLRAVYSGPPLKLRTRPRQPRPGRAGQSTTS